VAVLRLMIRAPHSSRFKMPPRKHKNMKKSQVPSFVTSCFRGCILELRSRFQ